MALEKVRVGCEGSKALAELNNKADDSNSKTFLELFNIKMILMKLKKNGRSFASSVCSDGDYSRFSAPSLGAN